MRKLVFTKIKEIDYSGIIKKFIKEAAMEDL